MSSYKVLTGHDAALVDLVLVDPQPRSLGVRPARRTYTASGTVIEDGYYIELLWDLVDDVAAWNALINQFGLGGALTAAVTVLVPHHQFAYSRYNGTAVRPEIGKEVQRTGYFLRNISILIRDLDEIP